MSVLLPLPEGPESATHSSRFSSGVRKRRALFRVQRKGLPVPLFDLNHVSHLRPHVAGSGPSWWGVAGRRGPGRQFHDLSGLQRSADAPIAGRLRGRGYDCGGETEIADQCSDEIEETRLNLRKPSR